MSGFRLSELINVAGQAGFGAICVPGMNKSAAGCLVQNTLCFAQFHDCRFLILFGPNCLDGIAESATIGAIAKPLEFGGLHSFPT